MKVDNKNGPGRLGRVFQSPFWLLLVAVLSVSAAELVIMIILHSIPRISSRVEIVLDAFLIAVFTFCAFWLFSFKPLIAHLNKRRQAENELQKARNGLEQQVEQRTSELVRSNLLLLREIDEHRQAADALNASEERYYDLFENASDLIFNAAPDGRLVYANHAWQQSLGCGAQEIRGISLFDMIHPDSRACFMETFQRVLAGETVENVETLLMTRNGKAVTIEANLDRSREKGKPVRVRGICRDITERKTLQQRLVQSEKLAAVGKLVSGVAHEINNPLTGVIGFAGLLKQEENGLGDKQRERLEMICSEATRIRRIVANLLSFARMHEPERKELDVNDAVETALSLCDYHLKVNNVGITRELGKDLPAVAADSHQIEQVFLNVINNAYQAMIEAHGKGNLTVRTYPRNGFVGIDFIDDGPGILKKNLTKLFDPFFTTKEVGKGTGLGLSVSYGIIKEHGGDIFAESEEGKGAKFTIELPVAIQGETRPGS